MNPVSICFEILFDCIKTFTRRLKATVTTSIKLRIFASYYSKVKVVVLQDINSVATLWLLRSFDDLYFFNAPRIHPSCLLDSRHLQVRIVEQLCFEQRYTMNSTSCHRLCNPAHCFFKCTFVSVVNVLALSLFSFKSSMLTTRARLWISISSMEPTNQRQDRSLRWIPGALCFQLI